MAAEESGFSRVFRGYDPDEVDRAIARLRRELLASKTEFDRLTAEVSQATETAAVLELELRAVGKMNLHALRLPITRFAPRQPRSNDVIAWNSPTRVSTSSRVRRCTRSVPNSSTLNDATIEPYATARLRCAMSGSVCPVAAR